VQIAIRKHLIIHSEQNAANTISDSSDSLQYLISKQFFDEGTSIDLIKIQEMISEAHNHSDYNDNLYRKISKNNSLEK
jgi:hypothetical protein